MNKKEMKKEIKSILLDVTKYKDNEDTLLNLIIRLWEVKQSNVNIFGGVFCKVSKNNYFEGSRIIKDHILDNTNISKRYKEFLKEQRNKQ